VARRRDPDETQGFDALRAAHDDAPEPAVDPAIDPDVVRTRRRFARRQWARRWLTWKPVLAVVLLLALVAGGVWLVYFSSYLAVHGVAVAGEHQLSAAEIERAAAVPTGEPLATADLDRIRARIEALAPVRSADVTRQWPDHVLVTVTEREPVAVVSIGGQLRGLDEEGVVFRDFAQAPPDLPRIETAADTGTDALREGALVVAALPGDLAARVDHVDVETVDEITLELRDDRRVVWGSSAESDLKSRVLAGLIAAVPDAAAYDVSVPGQPTTR
jgi:cell division protein FtsQ